MALHRLRTIKSLFLSILLLHCVACSHWPPVVKSAKDVSRLRESEASVRARSLTDSDITSLARLQNLRYLDFGGGWAVEDAAITDTGLRELSKLDLPLLEHLDLGHCFSITDSGVAHISTMHSLTLINLFFCDRLTDASLLSLSQMPRLKDLGLMGCDGITDVGLLALVKQESLRWLDLRGCSGITDRGLEHLASKKNWGFILFGGCANVSPEAVARLQAAIPSATIRKDEHEWALHLEEANLRPGTH